METGGSVQQANQAFCLCLCSGVRGLSTLAQEQQLVQRKRREREGDEDRGGGGDREHMKEEEIDKSDMGLKLYSFLFRM